MAAVELDAVVSAAPTAVDWAADISITIIIIDIAMARRLPEGRLAFECAFINLARISRLTLGRNVKSSICGLLLPPNSLNQVLIFIALQVLRLSGGM